MSTNLDEDALNIYTDGSCLPKPRRGGIGVRLVYVDLNGEEVHEDFEYPGYMGATNNQMELLACITGLEEARSHPVFDQYNKIVVLTDSKYVSGNIDNAKYIWSKNRYNKSGGAPVLNEDLWKKLVKLLKDINKRISIKWIKGHSKDKNNKAVDKLAKKSANSVLNPPLNVTSVRRKKTDRKTIQGSVLIKGQRITIYIIETQPIRKDLFRYRYEVVSKKSESFKNADWIMSEIPLRDGHTYHVRVNNEMRNPRIEKLFREICKS